MGACVDSVAKRDLGLHWLRLGLTPEILMRARTMLSIIVMSTLAMASSGCYEDAGAPPPPQPQQAAGTQEGPLTEMARGGGGSSPALGPAKRTATNIKDRAEQKSREVADQADDPLADKPKSEPTPTDDPG